MGSVGNAAATVRRSAIQGPPAAIDAIRSASAARAKNAMPSSLVNQPSFSSFT